MFLFHFALALWGCAWVQTTKPKDSDHMAQIQIYAPCNFLLPQPQTHTSSPQPLCKVWLTLWWTRHFFWEANDKLTHSFHFPAWQLSVPWQPPRVLLWGKICIWILVLCQSKHMSALLSPNRARTEQKRGVKQSCRHQHFALNIFEKLPRRF